MKTILTYGTYDILHWGHIRLLERAKQSGDFLIVALSTDEFNEKKGKTAYYSFEKRKTMLRALKNVDLIIVENSWEQKKNDIIKYNVDMLVMGDDWKGQFDYLAEFCEINYLERTEGISTTIIKKEIINLYKEDTDNGEEECK